MSLDRSPVYSVLCSLHSSISLGKKKRVRASSMYADYANVITTIGVADHKICDDSMITSDIRLVTSNDADKNSAGPSGAPSKAAVESDCD